MRPFRCPPLIDGRPALMLLYNMLPNCDNSEARYLALWRIGIIKKSSTKGASAAAAEDLNVKIADFLAQRVAIDPEQICGADLVAAGGRKRHRQERMLDLP